MPSNLQRNHPLAPLTALKTLLVQSRQEKKYAPVLLADPSQILTNNPEQQAVTTTGPMSANANEDMPTDWDSASYHGPADTNEQPYRAQFSHGLPTPTDDRDRDPVYEDDLYNLDPPDSDSTGRVRERVTNEWVASTGSQPIDPSHISSPEIPSTRLPSTGVPSPEEALDVDQVGAIETELNGHNASSPRRTLPLRSRRVADQAPILNEPRPRLVEAPVNRYRVSKPVEAEAHLNPRLEGRISTTPESS